MMRFRLPVIALMPLLFAFGAARSPAAPLGGDWEGELQSDKWPIFVRIHIERGKHPAATMFVLGQTISLGDLEGGTKLDSVAGQGSTAVRVSAQLVQGHLQGTFRQSGKDFPFSLEPVPSYAPTKNRIVGWSRDLESLKDRLLSFDRSFTPATSSMARAAIEQLRRDIPRLSDDEVIVRFARIIALADNGHTRLYLLRNRTEVRRVPFRLWWFGSDLRVLRAAPGFEQYLGCRVDRIGTFDSSAAKARVLDLFAGSPTWRTYMSTYSLTSPEVLHGTGITSRDDQVRYAFSDCDATGERSISALPLVKSARPLESWWDLAPAYAGTADNWKQVMQSRLIAVPLYLQHPEQNYWFSLTPGKLLFVQYNRAADGKHEPLAEFGKRVGDAIGSEHPRAIIVDLRFNTGGNGFLTKPLLDAVAAAPASTPVYVIVGRATFSAGIVAAAQFREVRAVTIVGEPVGDRLDFWAEGGNIVLPYSGLYVHFANGAHSLSPKPCPTSAYCNDLAVKSLEPDIPAPLGWADYMSGRDVAMDAVIADVARRSEMKKPKARGIQ